MPTQQSFVAKAILAREFEILVVHVSTQQLSPETNFAPWQMYFSKESLFEPKTKGIIFHSEKE